MGGASWTMITGSQSLCYVGAPTTTTDAIGSSGVPGCSASPIATFAGMGSCSAEITEQDVADFWCQNAGHTAGASWTMITGSQSLCYVGASYSAGAGTALDQLKAGAKYHTGGYGCNAACKCLQNLQCIA